MNLKASDFYLQLQSVLQVLKKGTQCDSSELIFCLGKTESPHRQNHLNHHHQGGSWLRKIQADQHRFHLHLHHHLRNTVKKMEKKGQIDRLCALEVNFTVQKVLHSYRKCNATWISDMTIEALRFEGTVSISVVDAASPLTETQMLETLHKCSFQIQHKWFILR